MCSSDLVPKVGRVRQTVPYLSTIRSTGTAGQGSPDSLPLVAAQYPEGVLQYNLTRFCLGCDLDISVGWSARVAALNNF